MEDKVNTSAIRIVHFIIIFTFVLVQGGHRGPPMQAVKNMQLRKPAISIIAAMSPNRAIGFKGRLPWSIPEDLAHFKRLTMGHTIIMGRHTYESLPHGALPGRRNVILSRSQDFAPVGCEVYESFAEALAHCDKSDETFIIGGSEVYRTALPFADKLYITLVDDNPEAADTFFPQFNQSCWTITKQEKHDGFSFVEFCKTNRVLQN